MQQDSQRSLVAHAQYPDASAPVVADVDRGQRIDIIVIVRPRQPISEDLQPFHYLTREEFLARHGAGREDVEAVVAFLKAHRLEPTLDEKRRSVLVSGAIGDIERAFQITMSMYRTLGGSHRGYAGQATVPAHLGEIIVAVLGLHTGRLSTGRSTSAGAANGHGPKVTPRALGTPTALREQYDFPDGDGAGQTIGLVELGGGYRKQDVDAYFASLDVSPSYRDVLIGSGRQAGFNHQVEDRFLVAFADWMNSKGPYMRYAKAYFEVTMDLSLIGALVPAAELQVYFAYDSTLAFMHLIEHALFVADPQPSVLSVSWGYQERELLNDSSDVATAHQINALFLSAAHMGVTLCCSGGDWGASNQVEDGFPGTGYDVGFPASSPWALACGGTTVADDGTEVVWNSDFPPPSAQVPKRSLKHGATGGGYSRLFRRPAWQRPLVHDGRGIDGNGRGVPDVAAVADPHCGIRCQLAGTTFPTGGTSAAAPTWAALVALLNQNLGTRVGCINPILYAHRSGNPAAFNDILIGDNRFTSDDVGFDGGPGWNPCTGLGSPNGKALLDMLKHAAS